MQPPTSTAVLAGVPIATLAGAVWVMGIPAPLFTWIMLAGAHVALVRMAEGRPGSAWLALVVLATALTAPTAISGVVVAVFLGVVVAGRPDRYSVRIVLAMAIPAVALSVLISLAAGRAVPPLFFAAGGALAGVLFHALSEAVSDRAMGDVAVRIRAVLDHGLRGAAAAMLGVAVAIIGPLFTPLVVVAVMALAAIEPARRQAAGARQGTIRSLLRAVETKDLYTRGHCERVAGYAEMIGREMGFVGSRLEHLRHAALLHDVGKVAIPRRLLRKRDRLDAAEYCAVQEHADAAGVLLDGIDFLRPAVPVILEHHLGVDGDGYGQAGAGGLSVEARILAVADAFDAMTSHRPYRRALTRDYAVAELLRHSGSQFDADVVTAFRRRLEADDVWPAAVGFESDAVARLAALGMSDVPEAIHAGL